MIDKIEIHQSLLDSAASSKQIKGGPAHTDNNTDVTVQVDNANLIKKALQIPESDPLRLEKARELLLSGRLESPESFLEAAQNLYDFGV
jgi:hypothetical protein